MIKNERFRVFPSIIGEFSQAYRQPCVVFASDCTLRLGASAHFMQIWCVLTFGGNPNHRRSNANNALVHIDPYVEMASAIGPYQPMAMRAYNCAIDTRLTQNEVRGFQGICILTFSCSHKYNFSRPNRKYFYPNRLERQSLYVHIVWYTVSGYCSPQWKHSLT
jgi:hypothetical protein